MKSIAELNKDKKIENIPSTIQGFWLFSSSSQSTRTNLAHFRQPKQLKNNSFQHADRRSTPRRFRVHCWRSRSQVAIPLHRSYVLVLIINKKAAFFALKSAGCTDTSINHTSNMRAPVLLTPPRPQQIASLQEQNVDEKRDARRYITAAGNALVSCYTPFAV